MKVQFELCRKINTNSFTESFKKKNLEVENVNSYWRLLMQTRRETSASLVYLQLRSSRTVQTQKLTVQKLWIWRQRRTNSNHLFSLLLNRLTDDNCHIRDSDTSGNRHQSGKSTRISRIKLAEYNGNMIVQIQHRDGLKGVVILLHWGPVSRTDPCDKMIHL